MHVSVLNLFDFVRVAMVGEPSEAGSVEINCQRLVARDKNIDAHVELFAADQKWVHDVSLNDVRLSLRTLWLPSEVVLPLRNLSQFV